MVKLFLLPCVLAVVISSIAIAGDDGLRRMVSDTLDLTVRAEYALNALAGTVDPEHHCEFLFSVSFVPPSMRHDAFSFAACGPKYIESWAMLRLMTGSRQNLEIEKCATDYMMSCLGEDGMFYNRIGPDRPWDNTSPEDWANIYGQARMLRAMLVVSQVDGDSVWKERMARLVETLKKIAIYKDDYAYYPTTPGYGDIFSYPKSGWKVTELLTGAQKTMADVPDHSFGIPLYIGGLVSPLVKYYEQTGDRECLELAGKLVRFLLKPESGWMPDGVPQGVVPEEHGWFYGHFHGHTMCLVGLLDYAFVTNDMKLKNLVRDGYEYSRLFGIARLGWFHEYTGKASHETCGLANMIALAVKLSRCGMGDYWDDVDAYLRNHLTEAQFIDLNPAKKANKDVTAEQELLLERLQGCFAGWGAPNALEPRIMNCCLANGSQALYYGWDSIVEWDQVSQATIHLLLNRNSPWLDIDSYLPYEGKVVIHNKQAAELNVRIPAWVEKKAVTVQVDDRNVSCRWLGNYLTLVSLKPDSRITIIFPISTTRESYRVRDYGHRGTKLISKTQYTIIFKGNTAIDIEPKDSLALFPTYRRTQYQASQTPIKAKMPYTATSRIDW